MTKLERRLNFYKDLVQFIYTNQKEIAKKLEEMTETQTYYRPGKWLSSQYSHLSDVLIDSINEMFDMEMGERLSYQTILDYLLPGYDR